MPLSGVLVPVNRSCEPYCVLWPQLGAVSNEERTLIKIRDSTMRTLLVVEIVSFSVLLS